MKLSNKEPADPSPTQVPADAMAIFDAFRAKGVDIALAYTATERIRGLINERSFEIARLLRNELNGKIDSLAHEMRTGFAAVRERFEGIEEHLVRVDRRLDGVEGRLGNVEVGVAGLQGRHDSIDKRLDSLASMFRWGLVLVGLAFSVVGVVLTILAMLLSQALQENRLSVRPAQGPPIGIERPERAVTTTHDPAARSPETAGDERDVPAEDNRE